MGRIPGFTTKIFPTSSLNIFIVFADIGLIFFMNLIGLELNFDLMAADWKRTAIISVATMAVPFVISIGSSWAVWESIDQAYPSEHPKSFGTYLLFMYVHIQTSNPSEVLDRVAAIAVALIELLLTILQTF